MRLTEIVFSRRNTIALLLMSTASVLLFSQSVLVHSAEPQQAKRSFEIYVSDSIPLKVKLKQETEAKALDPNNKDWFRDIAIEVTNTSDKPIYFFTLNLEMPDASPDILNPPTFRLQYGRPELADYRTKFLPEDKPLGPKATHILVIDEKSRNEWAALRAANKRTDPMRLELFCSELIFGDGTGIGAAKVIVPMRSNPE